MSDDIDDDDDEEDDAALALGGVTNGSLCLSVCGVGLFGELAPDKNFFLKQSEQYPSVSAEPQNPHPPIHIFGSALDAGLAVDELDAAVVPLAAASYSEIFPFTVSIAWSRRDFASGVLRWDSSTIK